jgi:hypothetical protein
MRGHSGLGFGQYVFGLRNLNSRMKDYFKVDASVI